MFLQKIEITPGSRARELVIADHRTADVFRSYGIDYCCGLSLPLAEVCETKDIPLPGLLADLRKASRSLRPSPALSYDSWAVDFLIDYILHVHHYPINTSLPHLSLQLSSFVAEHENKYPYFSRMQQEFEQLRTDLVPHLRHEEEIIFPYLRQVAHAFEETGKNSFAGLLVKTMRKPLDQLINQEHRLLQSTIFSFRELTSNYFVPPGACASHRVILGKLQDLDDDLVQHYYLENEILIPRVIQMEKELLSRHP